MPKAQIEPLAGVIRVLVDDHGQHGDPFYWSASVRWLKPDEIELLAYMNKITPSIYRAVFAECQRWGVTRILAVNYPNGADGERKTRWFEVPTKPQQFYRRNANG